jgi:hypothetical protein
MSIVNSNNQTINDDDNAGLSAIGAGIGTGLGLLGSGIGTAGTAVGTGISSGYSAYGTAIAGAITGKATIDAGSTAASWIQRLLLAAAEAAAQILILEYQKKQYDEIVERQLSAVDQAVNEFTSDINRVMSDFNAGAGSKPRAAAYVPVNWTGVQCDAIEWNLNNGPKAAALQRWTDTQRHSQQLVRIQTFYDSFKVHASLYDDSVTSLLKGLVDVGDVMEVMTDVAENACLVGRMGRTCKQTSQALGVTKMRAQALGRAEFRERTRLAELVSPVGTLFDPASMFVQPERMMQFALEQAQLVQQSLQNQLNAQTAGDPRALARAQARLSMAIAKLQANGSKANLVNAYVPNYASILAPSIKNISEGIFGTTSPSYNSSGQATGTNYGLAGIIGNAIGF